MFDYPPAVAQEIPSQLFNGLRWRLVAPFRGGRVVAVSGVPGSDRDFFYGGESQLKKLDSKDEINPTYLADAIHTALARLQAIKSGDHGEEENNVEREHGLAEANAGLGVALRMVESGHRAAPAQALVIADEMGKSARAQTAAWRRFKTTELSDVNAALIRANRKPLQISAIEEQVHYAMTR